jgi:hypothetical protein
MQWAQFFILAILTSSHSWAQLCVTADGVALRAEPRAQAKIVATLGIYQPLRIIKKSKNGSYYEVKTSDNIRGFVTKTKTLFGRTCYQSQTDKKYLRSSPVKRKSNRLRIIEKGESFLQVGADDGWLQLESSKGELVWIEIDSLWQPAAHMRLSFEPKSITGN